MTFPLNGRDARLGIGIFFKLDSDIFDQVAHVGKGFKGMAMRSLREIFIPFRVSGLVSIKPFKEPRLGVPYLQIDGFGEFTLEVLLNRHFS